MKKVEYVDPKETRTEAQRLQYEEINRSGKCPFCPDQFIKIHKKPIIKENESWLATENETPYEGTKYHFLFVFKGEHTSTFDNLTNNEKIHLFDLISQINSKYNIKSGAFLMRYGDSGNGSSVRHLHCHIIVGGNNKEQNPEKIKVKVGYKK